MTTQPAAQPTNGPEKHTDQGLIEQLGVTIRQVETASPLPQWRIIDLALIREARDWIKSHALDTQTAQPDRCLCPQHGSWINGEDVDRLVRELDVAWNGEAGAAKQARLCDMVSQIVTELPTHHRRVMEFRNSDGSTDVVDLSPAMRDSKIRDRLIELGWKAPE